MLAGFIGRFQVLVERVNMAEQLLFHCVQQLPRLGSRLRIGRHQLRMWKTLVNVLIDDIGLIQHQIPIHQYRYSVVGIDDGHLFRLVKQVDIDDLEVHLFFEQHYSAAMTEWAGSARIQIHHSAGAP